MTQSTHDLIAAKAARLRALMRLTESAPDAAEDGGTPTEQPRYGPTWSGGWAN